MSKKALLLFPSSSTLSAAVPPRPARYHSARTPCYRHCEAARHPRNYAQHASQTPHPSSGREGVGPGVGTGGEEWLVDLSWPEPMHPQRTPTPYQILSCTKNEPYTKRRFYSLVKLYHPDQCHPTSPVFHLPQNVRLERYRLLIAAHTILSDPAKRSAYDLWGHGWAGHIQTPEQRAAYGWEGHPPREWPGGRHPMHNATWEDWEQWYQEQAGNGPKQRTQREPLMSNFGFVSALFALISIGGVLQGTRASMFSSTVMERADKMHREASIELGRSKRATMSTGDRSERIETFLRHREAVQAGEPAYQRILPDPELCATDEVRKQ